MRHSFLYSIVIFVIINYSYDSNFCKAKNVTVQMLEDFGTKTNATISGEISETHYATCRIATEELVANAEATITRVLTGMCNAEILENRFTTLENILRKEFDDIKRTLNILVDNNNRDRQFNYANHENNDSIDSTIVDPRQSEIDRYNSTIQELRRPTGSVRIFIYFFHIDRFDEKIAHWESGKSIRSSTFYVSPRGYAMYLKVTPRYFPDGDENNQPYVKFATGVTRGRYDETLDWPFPLKHRIEILDHPTRGNRRQDLTSGLSVPSNSSDSSSDLSRRRPAARIQDNPDNREWVGLTIPASVLLDSGSNLQSSTSSLKKNQKYLWQDKSLTIKLTVFL